MKGGYRRLSKSLTGTEVIAGEFARLLKPGDFVSLTGSLGAGKTRFVSGIVKYICRELQSSVSSPTFTIMNRYCCGVTIDHFDFYRLNDIRDLENCGFFDSLLSNSITIAEWGDKIFFDHKIFLKDGYYKVKIDFADEKTDWMRKIIIEGKKQVKH